MRRWVAIAALVALSLSTVTGWGQSTGTITVNPGESIQSVIDRAPDGAVICLPPGTWHENLAIDKSITLRSASGPATAERVLVFRVLGIDTLPEGERAAAVDGIIQAFQDRAALYGITGVEVTATGTDQVSVTLPLAVDQEQVIDLLSRSGRLEFRRVVATATDRAELKKEQGAGEEILPNRDKSLYYLVGEALLTGADIAGARAQISESPIGEDKPYIAISLSEAGAKRFVQVLADLKVDDKLAIVLDGIVYTAPRITQSIKDAAAQGWQTVQNAVTIAGNFTKDEATRIAAVLQSGVLPYPVEIVHKPESTAVTLHQVDYGPAIKIGTATAAGSVRVVLAGLTVNGTISASGTSELEIRDCMISGGEGDGIELGQDVHVVIDGCTVTGSNGGIVLWNRARATISNTTVSKNARGGIELWDETVATIRGCTVINHQLPGILMQNNANATIESCTLQANEYGVALSKSARATIKGCNITKNEIGVVCWDDSTVDINGSTVADNGAGFVLADSSQATLVGNEIKRNDQGIALFDPACTDTDQHFQGRVTGHSNVIPGPDDPNGNSMTAVCPLDLSFLTSEAGGKFDRHQ